MQLISKAFDRQFAWNAKLVFSEKKNKKKKKNLN